MLKLWTDTNTDITLEEAKRLNCKLISMPFVIQTSDLDEITWYPYKGKNVRWPLEEDIYSLLRKNKIELSSFCLNIAQYKNLLAEEFSKGNDILYVHMSATTTSTFTFLRKAYEELHKKYPDRKIYEIDTGGVTGLNLLAFLDIADKYNEGDSAKDIAKWFERNKQHYAMYFFADSLKYFIKGGKVSKVSGTLGNMFGIKPLLYNDEEGNIVQTDKIRGTDAAMNWITSKMEELGNFGKNCRVVISHSGCMDLAENMKEKINTKFPYLEAEIHEINPLIGSHCGPDVVGVGFYALHR